MDAALCPFFTMPSSLHALSPSIGTVSSDVTKISALVCVWPMPILTFAIPACSTCAPPNDFRITGVNEVRFIRYFTPCSHWYRVSLRACVDFHFDLWPSYLNDLEPRALSWFQTANINTPHRSHEKLVSLITITLWRGLHSMNLLIPRHSTRDSKMVGPSALMACITICRTVRLYHRPMLTTTTCTRLRISIIATLWITRLSPICFCAWRWLLWLWCDRLWLHVVHSTRCSGTRRLCWLHRAQLALSYFRRSTYVNGFRKIFSFFVSLSLVTNVLSTPPIAYQTQFCPSTYCHFQHPKTSAARLFSSCRVWCPFLWRPSKVRIAVSIPSSFLRRFPRTTMEVGAWYSLSQTWYHSLLMYLYSNIINNSSHFWHHVTYSTMAGQQLIY